MKIKTTFISLLAFSFSAAALAAAPRPAVHEDLFGEDAILIGFKLGPELTGYTSVQTGTAIASVQSSVRFVGGAAFEFIYGWPIFEADLLWNARGHINTSDTYHAISFPALIKLPWHVEKDIALFAGAGFESDAVVAGAEPHRDWMFGVLGSIGVTVDLHDCIFEFEGRYNVGLSTIADEVNGAMPRDVQIIGGLLWRF